VAGKLDGLKTEDFMTDETDETGAKRRLKNPRSAARPSLRARARPEQRTRHTGLGGGPAELGHLSDRKTRLLSLHGLDKRTPAYLETKKLITAIEADLGGAEALSAAERQIVQHAAITGAMITDMEVRYLAGQAIDTSEYGFLVGVQHRLFSLIGLRRRPRDVTPNLEDVLRDEP
jgi:hypothetical protein